MKLPEISKDEAEKYLQGQLKNMNVRLLGIRGFFEPEGNKRGIYDDALFIVLPDGILGYNANTDPSVERAGIAVLQPGTYWYIKGLHGLHHLKDDDSQDQAILQKLVMTGKDYPPVDGKILPYWALRQDSNVMVLRDGKTEPETDSPDSRFWIDIHKGGYNTTSSEGCQTIYPPQWEGFRMKVYKEMKYYGQTRVPYILCNKKAG